MLIAKWNLKLILCKGNFTSNESLKELRKKIISVDEYSITSINSEFLLIWVGLFKLNSSTWFVNAGLWGLFPPLRSLPDFSLEVFLWAPFLTGLAGNAHFSSAVLFAAWFISSQPSLLHSGFLHFVVALLDSWLVSSDKRGSSLRNETNETGTIMKFCGNKTNKNSNFFVERTSVVTLDFSRRGAVCIFFIAMAGKLYYKKKSNSGKIPSQKSNAKARTSTVNKLRYFRAIFDWIS